jgi:hypothetical protein
MAAPGTPPSVTGSLSSGDLQNRIVGSYFIMRAGIGIIGIGFPLLLLLGGLTEGICPQNSMSAYYHALGPHLGSMRNWFVGLLFMIAISLGLYRGFSVVEDLVLDAAAVLGVCVALFPMAWEPAKEACPGSTVSVPGATLFGLSMHLTCAIAFFLCIAFVCWFCADDTLPLIADPARRGYYRLGYRTIAILMPVCMLPAWLVSGAEFWAEALGVMVFGAYWLLKNKELEETAADKKAFMGRLRLTGGEIEELDERGVVVPHDAARP